MVIGNNLEDATNFIRDLFLNNSGKEREIFTHCTIATDASNVELVFKSTMNVILTNNIKNLGLV